MPLMFVNVYDGDIQNPSIQHVATLLAPLIDNNKIGLCKANFDRNLHLHRQVIKNHGGRQTELLVKPLMGFLFPELVKFSQPTGGLYSVKRKHLQELEVLGEAGADMSILVNYAKRFGIDKIAEAHIGEIKHRNKELNTLAKTSPKLIQSLFYLAKRIDEFQEYALTYKEQETMKVKIVKSSLIILPPHKKGENIP